jgi:hypothetical protein
MKSELDEQNAFEVSAQQMGQPALLKREFKRSERIFMKKTLIILLGIFAILFGPGIFLPALAQHYHQGVSSSSVIVPMVAGIIITLAGVGAAIFGFRKRNA